MSEASTPADIFFLDRARGGGLQTQIREMLVAAILSRRLTPGARLPSTRKLAGHLGVSRITVTLAYNELVAQGYLAPAPRSGFYVAQTAPVSRLNGEARGGGGGDGVDWAARLRPRRAAERRIVKPRDWRSYPYPFIYGQMDMTVFDHTAWRDCARRALGRRDFDDMAADMAASDDPMLVNYIAARTLPRRGVTAGSEEILVTVGAQNALWIAVELLMGEGARAACEDPGYPDLAAALAWRGAAVSPVPVDDAGLAPEALPRALDAVFVTPSHHAPTAATMPIARRLALIEAASARDFVIVEDDYDFEMSFIAPPTPALKSLDREGRVIYVGSFSKALFPGLRLGYLVAPAPFIRAARDLRALMLRHPPGHLQRTVAHFLALGHFDALMRRARALYRERREALVRALAAHGLAPASANAFGGTSLWMRGPDGLDSDRLAEELAHEGVLIEPGAPFFVEAAGPCPYYRLGYSSIPAERIDEGVARLAAALARAG